jgi:hypothetical protein
MPISKKRRSKAALRTSTKAGAPAALPDRRAMESFLAAIAGRRNDESTGRDLRGLGANYLPFPDRACPQSTRHLAALSRRLCPSCRRSPIYRGGSRLLREGRRGGRVGARATGLQAVCRPLLGLSRNTPLYAGQGRSRGHTLETRRRRRRAMGPARPRRRLAQGSADADACRPCSGSPMPARPIASPRR